MLLSLSVWGLLPAIVVGAGGVPESHPASIKSIQIDSHFAQASFVVTCANCTTSSSSRPDDLGDLDLLFDLSLVPGPQPCSSNLTLNSISLDHRPQWDTVGPWEVGTSPFQLIASGHDLTAQWFTSCLFTVSPGPATRLLTLSVLAIDGSPVFDGSSALGRSVGFTVSFKDDPTPEIFRITGSPFGNSSDFPSWADPPADLRIDSSIVEELPKKGYTLEDHIEDLRLLEAELEFLQAIISEKKKVIHSQFHTSISGLKEEVRNCEGFLCIIKAVFRKAHGAARAAYLKLRPNPYNDTVINQGLAWHTGHQIPTMIATKDEKTPSAFPQPPQNAHCRDGKSSEKPAPDDCSSHKTIPDSRFRDAVPPSKLAILLKIFFTITGIALILAILRRRCASPRKRRDRLARLEQRRAERAYRRSARRQAFWDWWHGRRRGNPGRRPGDYDEKQALVNQQESVLEGHMQNDINQLQIQEEIRQFRDTRDVVDELVRAEEGRAHAPAPPYPAFHPSSYSHRDTVYPAGFTAVPRPISIPSSSSSPPATASPSTDVPFSPMSRTTSLPSYRSKPPSYRSGGDTDIDGFSDCALSIEIGTDTDLEDDAWSPGSSIPDLSPRPSAETARTFL